ncbi:MAG: extracellular solute-binding protein [Deltaproteobacteria bacterium]|nr:extracellular solute-binding protein [Deltaproteobacteria bacterium]
MMVAALALLCGCRIEIGAPAASTSTTDARPSGKVVLYTSAYREVTDALTTLAQRELPEVELVVFQGGSEKVAARLDADLQSGKAGADVLLVSDPFLYRRLKREEQLLPWASPFATPIDRGLVDLDNAFCAARVSTMVIAFHNKKTTAAEVPASFAKLLLDDDAPAKDVALGDPLSSGTAFMTVVAVGNGDVSFLGKLRARGASIAGGNSVVLQKVLAGERRFGVVLLENVLAARARGEPVGFIIPSDGAIVVAGDVAILKDTRNETAARAVVDLVLSPAGQELMRGPNGNMHAVDPRLLPPAEDVPTLAELMHKRAPDRALLDRVSADRRAVLNALEQGLMGTP